MTSDYSWSIGDNVENHLITEEECPGRFALTAPQYILRHGGTEFLVVDPHPEGTWMNWMFPYASLIVTSDDLTEPDELVVRSKQQRLTLRDLAGFLVGLREANSKQYMSNILDEVNNVIPGISEGWQGDPCFENYSLKYSKTSASFTAYVFEYYRSELDNISLDVPHLWVPVEGAMSWLGSASNIGTRTVSSNVLDLVGHLSRK